MVQDVSVLNPKGHVKIELYNENNEVFFTKEKKNLVVLDSNKIIADILADPTKQTRMTQTDSGNTSGSPNEKGLYVFRLSVNPLIEITYTLEVAASNTDTEFFLEDQNIEQLISVKENNIDLIIDEDVFLKDGEKAIISFKNAPTSAVEIKYLKLNDSSVKLVKGTETVKVAGELWTRSHTPSNTNKTYSINYETGEIFFESAKSLVEVKYDYKTKYCLGYMALGGKPESHPDNKPVTFTDSDKNKKDMPEEFEGARVPIQFPCEAYEGSPEIEILPTKPVETETKVFTFTATDSNLDGNVDVTYKLESAQKVLEIKSIFNKTKSTTVDLETVSIDLNKAEITFQNPPDSGDQFEVTAKVKVSNNHLIYELSQSPIVGLVEVHHEDVNGNKTKYQIEKEGLHIGKGDVWILNLNKGYIQFSSNPSTGVPVETPGQLTIFYKVNSGRIVKFIADFPKDVPGPMFVETEKTIVASNGMTTFPLDYPIAKNESGNFRVIEVLRNGSSETYTVSSDGSQITVNNVSNGDTIYVKYVYEKDTFEIYQVAMFDTKNKETSKMFNISGIGPITKDKNTGIRVTWSVTF